MVTIELSGCVVVVEDAPDALKHTLNRPVIV